MRESYMIFDYFKEAYHALKANKSLYRPQIALIIIKTLMIFGIGIAVYAWLNQYNFDIPFDESDPLPAFLGWIAASLGLLLFYGIVSVIFESGLYNMYKSCVLHGEVEAGAFSEGIRKYAFKFALGYVLIALAWIIISPIYIFASLVTLMAGFGVIAFIIGIYLTMWKISMVMNDSGVFGAVKDSFRFASRHFTPLMFLQVIHWAFVKGSTTSSNTDGVYNILNIVGSLSELGEEAPEATNTIINSGPAVEGVSFMGRSPILTTQDAVDSSLQVAKIVMAIIIPVITIASLIAFLIKIVFEMFFALVLFIVYHRKFMVPEPIAEPDISEETETQADCEIQLEGEVGESCGLTN